MNPFDNLAVKNLLPTLEALYPEHKIFALSALDDDLREKLNELYQTLSYRNLEGFLHDIGYEIIPASEVRNMRNEVLYSPGHEPEPIRTKMKNLLLLLENYYPSHIIRGNLQADHKSLSSKISGLYQWLGYLDASSFLDAYGYQYQPVTGRPENDYQSLIEALLEKYSEFPKPKNMGMLIFDNPEYRGQLKTLQNKANELFGMSLKAFFTELGLFEEKGERSTATASTRTSSGSGSMQDAALVALKQLYDSLDTVRYGSYEDAVAKLEGITVKQNKAGKIYVFRVMRCPESLILPYGIDMLSKAAFQGETALRSISLPATLAEIPEDAFSGCSSLKELILPEGLVRIGNRAFAGCTALEHVSLPLSLQEVGNEAFAGCFSLAKVDTTNRVLRVEPDSFSDCPYRFEAFSDTESTPVECFDWTPGKKGSAVITGYHGDASSVRIPAIVDGKQVTTLGIGAFQGNETLKEVSMPDTIAVMQKDVFRDCTRLEKVHLSNGISKIITTTFTGCVSLREINIPDGVAELKRGTFRDAPITTLHIGKLLQRLSWDCFVTGQSDPYTGAWKYLRTILTVSVDPENQWLRAENGCIYSRDGHTLIAALKNYRSYVVLDGTETIGKGAFEHMNALTDISFPESLTQIDVGAFTDTGLRSIHFGRSIRLIGDNAFHYCSALSSVLFEDGVEEIGLGAFEGCPIVSVVLPASVHRLGARSFSCFGSFNDKMLDFRIAEGNPYLRADGAALYQLDGDNKTLSVLYGKPFRSFSEEQDNQFYVVEPGTTQIAEEACADCFNLEGVSLPEGLISIGAHAFRQCGLSMLTLPVSLCEIGEGAFASGKDWMGNYHGVGDIRVAGGNPIFFVRDEMLFARQQDGSCALVASFSKKDVLTLPEDTTKVYAEAFSGQPLSEVWLPSTVKEIGEAAFKGCDQLRRIHFGVEDCSGAVCFAIIYLPQVVQEGFFWDTSLRDQYMDCIRSGVNNSVFDFEKYDSLFPSISQNTDKVLVATDRLKSAVSLAPVYAENYRRYLKQDPELAVKVIITLDDADGLDLLDKLGCIQVDKLDEYIALANRSSKTSAQVYFMNYKNERVGFSDFDLFEL